MFLNAKQLAGEISKLEQALALFERRRQKFKPIFAAHQPGRQPNASNLDLVDQTEKEIRFIREQLRNSIEITLTQPAGAREQTQRISALVSGIEEIVLELESGFARIQK